jgi:hypothetical protein
VFVTTSAGTDVVVVPPGWVVVVVVAPGAGACTVSAEPAMSNDTVLPLRLESET